MEEWLAVKSCGFLTGPAGLGKGKCENVPLFNSLDAQIIVPCCIIIRLLSL